MGDTRRLKVIIDQEGNAKQGLDGIVKGFGGLSTAIPVAGAAVAAIGAVGAVTVGVGSKLIGLASDAEEMTGKFNVVFGDSAPMAVAALDEFGDAVGRSKFELMEMAASVQDTFVPMGFARDEAADLSIGLSKLAVDMGSFNNVADADVMKDLQSAIIGNHETMRKYGVVITAAVLDQELLRMGVEGGTKAATEQEKVQARLNLIMAGTADAHGDAERTAGSWANQMRALKATLSEAATTIGSELLPFVTPLLEVVTDLARTAIPPLLDIFKQVMSHLKTEMQPVLKEIFAAFGEIFEELGIGAGDVDWLKVTLDVLKGTITVVAHVLRGFATTLGHIASAVRAVGDALSWLSGKWDDMKRAARDAIDTIPKWLRPGSPTPFEIGLRGIGDAVNDINFKHMGMPTGGMPMAAAGVGVGGPQIIVNLTYSPGISLSNRYEAETELVPYIQAGLRKLGYG